MTNRASCATAAWAVCLALALAACGSQTSPPDSAATTANVTFRTDPAAEIWIDGKSVGTTPIVIAVAPGSHAVVFKAAGFRDEQGTLQVEAGKDLTVRAGLQVAGTTVDDYKRLLATLAVDHEDFGEVNLSRSGNDEAVTLYWPQADVRKRALTTYRIEITPDYEDDGFIEFRDGKEVLYREPFHAEELVTERALPAKVLEALKRGHSYTWGVYFDEPRKEAVTASFKVVDDRKVESGLAKLTKRQTWQRANPLMREMARIDVLRNYRMYSETLQSALGVLNTWPDTEIPYQAIAFSLERLKLKETPLYGAIAGALRGNKTKLRGNDLSGVSREGDGGQQAKLPPSAVAPRVRPDKGSGLKAGGLGVTPTPDAQKRAPGPVEPDAEAPEAGGGVTVGPARPDGERLDPRQVALDQLEQLAEEARVAEELLEQTAQQESEANAALEAANQAAEDARSALDALRASGTATDEQIQAAEKAVQDADHQVDDARGRLEQANEAMKQAQLGTQKVLAKTGPAEEAERKADELRREIESTPSTGPGSLPVRPAEPVPVPGPGGAPDEALDGAAREQALLGLRDAVDQARIHLDETAVQHEQAQVALAAAEEALHALQGDPGPMQEQMEAAEAALQAARDEAARAAIERERAQGEVQRAELELHRAELAPPRPNQRMGGTGQRGG